ncbi:class I SAM-dependent methyltransferase [Nesterenkonia alkaliphila]|uniref:Methyltransferase domain-containing protein n=1 Tax=Nesterenkonia alkaliphila TaxID=1463631 RepID=A0A7K1ULQ0_9MICC|nr:class I SAM-dependent methyltransferase [Nesterenkonia alkaliphila]MVT27393.1 methyltransferase domain-containing protein [Nesterenkonia alkaliphila]GFZ90071.1 methyltransferase type 11 [Nesterenkonia alkaliphila]
MTLPDFIRAANQRGDPQLYELENQAMDPDGALWTALEQAAPWAGRTLVDLGCGSGYWLPAYHAAGRLIAVEPDEDLLPLARARDSSAEMLHGSAEHLPLPDASADVVHARFAYFFPSRHFDPEPGLREVQRVLKPGGRLVVVDNDSLSGQFAELLQASPGSQAQGHGDYSTRWWAERGAVTTPVMSSWEFGSRQDFEDVLYLEFGETAGPWLAAHPEATGLSYGYLLHTWTRESRPQRPG